MGAATQFHEQAAFLRESSVYVDIIVPDVGLAVEKLSTNGFKQNPGSKVTVTDRYRRVWEDLHKGKA